MKLLRTVLLMLTLLPLSACGLSGGPIEGQVLEAGTNKPIPGAIVVVRWTGSMFAFAESQTKCVHVETATTDVQGRYKIALWVGTFPGLIQDLRPDVTAYKPGYVRSPEYFKQQSYRQGIELMEEFKGASGERLKGLERMLDATRCGSQNDSERHLYPMYSAMYEEAKNIAVSKEDTEIVDTLRYWASFVILDKNKPMTRDAKGRLINVGPKGK